MFVAKSEKFRSFWSQRSGAGRTKWLVKLIQVGSGFGIGQETSPGHGGQVHVQIRPLARAEFFLMSCGSSTWSGKCLLDRGDGPGWIKVWAYRPEGQLGVISDKNGEFQEILGSNIYGNHPGSYFNKGCQKRPSYQLSIWPNLDVQPWELFKG